MRPPIRPLLFLAFALISCNTSWLPVRTAKAESAQERAALLAFLSAVPHGRRIQWTANSSSCDWFGVTCSSDRSTVVALRLPAVGLVGPIPPGTLGRLSALRVLSLHSNRLSGPIPESDLGNLTLLRALYLQNNLFSGGIPPAIGNLTRLSRLDLSSNNLTGTIPFALNNLVGLTGLLLENNRISGSLPSISINSLVDFNVSYNALNGSIPRTLERFPASSFVGNLDLCGGPLPPCNPFFPSPAPSPAAEGGGVKNRTSSKRKLSTAAIVAISVGCGAALLLLLAALVACLVVRQRRSQSGDKKGSPAGAATAAGVARSGETGTSSSKDAGAGGAAEAERNRLVFVGRGGGYSFDLEDLLRASAEVLGKGSVGTSYKAVLEDGTTVVVKRLKDVAVGKREFEALVEGSLAKPEAEHDNLLLIRAYYYSKDEKLLVFDYLPAGSLSAFLHGGRALGRTPLDWESRMRIALAAGRGLSHLHTVAKLVHGNLKASNVLLRSDLDSCVVADYGLYSLFGSAAAPISRIAGYRAPEVMETRKPTFKSDVYSYGVLLLELLTGKAPNQASLQGDEGVDLPRWVQSVVREEWTAEVFDVELMRYPNIEEEMVQLLQIAMACCSAIPDARPDMAAAVRMIEQVIGRNEGRGQDEALQGSPDPSGVGDSGEPATPPPAAGTP